ncbi:MAG TPA: sigma-70 family RNA polymerase sigma factor [Saprospiraceae bacterium]|nr:sigma-70 family RNA polymerase sigma factor [Saprospiraceae bacterium]
MMKSDQYTERELVQGCVQNNRSHQEILYRRYFPTMMRMCMRYTDDREVALEIVNTGLLRVFQKLHTFTFAGSLEGWIRRIVFHSLSDHFKKKNNSIHFLDVEDRDTPVRATATSDLYFEDIIKLVDMLPGATREVFYLYAIEGYNHAEIGEQLQMSEGTSKWHLSVARKKLKDLIQKHYNLNSYVG